MSPHATSSTKCCTARLSIRPRHMRAVSSSSTRNPIDTTFNVPSPHGRTCGTIFLLRLARLALEAAVDAEHARDRETPDVGVEHADGETPRSQCGGEVRRDRGLADPTLARRDHDDLRGGRDLGVGRVGPRVPASLGHRRRLLGGVELGPVELDLPDAGQRADARPDVLLDLGAKRAARGGETDGDRHGAVVADAGAFGHAEVDDVAAELGIDDASQQREHLV